MKTRRRRLKLIYECKIKDLLHQPPKKARLEASGVELAGGRYCIVFDNMTQVAAIDTNLGRGKKNRLLGPTLQKEGFEDIAFDERKQRFFLLHEAMKRTKGGFSARIVESGDDFIARADRWVDFPFDGSNKGYEGLTCIYRHGELFLLALCEGNKCCGGKKGRKPGNGRIHVLQRRGAGWRPVARLKLPRTVDFEDYSGIDLRNGRLAIVSQASSALWVGTLTTSHWAIAGRGFIFEFPKKPNNDEAYCNVEGVKWVSDQRVAVVSDRCKKGKRPQPKRCKAKAQSFHLFDIPKHPARH